MGLFSKLFNTPTNYTYAPKNENEAWVAILYACISADGEASEIETDKMSEFLVFKQAFNGHDIAGYYRSVLEAHKKLGSQGIIDASAKLISDDNKPTLLALIMELLLADGVLEAKEQEIAEYIVSKLLIDESVAEKIIEVILIKNKGNCIIV